MAIDQSAIKYRLLRIGARVHHHLWLARAMTLGTRAVVIGDGKVFLIRHTYRPGWYLPGGAVDRGESAEKAVARELLEEGGILCAERPVLHGVYRNGRRDHVACYIVRRFEVGADRKRDWEIAEAGFFALDGLPDGTTRATHARLAEVIGGRKVSEDW